MDAKELMAHTDLFVGCIPYPACEVICDGFLSGEVAGNFLHQYWHMRISRDENTGNLRLAIL